MTQFKKVVLIDDDRMLHWAFRTYITKMLPEIGFVSFGDGLEAGEAISKFDDAVVLLDLNMPRQNGYEFLSTNEGSLLRADMHLYVLSSSVCAEEIERARQFKCVRDFIEKPMPFSKLNKLLSIKKDEVHKPSKF